MLFFHQAAVRSGNTPYLPGLLGGARGNSQARLPKIPFTTSKLADILDLFHIPPRTSSNTLGLCDAWGHFFSSLRFSVGLSSRDPGPTL